MSVDTLKPSTRAALLLLMALTVEVSNPEIKERFHVTISKPDRARLEKLKLIKARQGRRGAYFHELTDPGWALAREELTGELPTGLWGRAIAYALATQLQEYLGRAGLALADFFATPAAAADNEAAAADGPTAADGPAAVLDAPGDLASRLRGVYWSLAPKPEAWIGLADLRGPLADVPGDELDEALRQLARADDVTLAPESNKKSLTDADKAAAVRIGRQDNHLIAIERA